MEAPLAMAAMVLRSLQSLFLVRFCDALSVARPRPVLRAAILLLLACYPAYSLWAMLFPRLAPIERSWLQNGVTLVNAYILVRVARMRGSVDDPDLKAGLGFALYIGAAVSILFGVIDDNFLRLRELDPYLDNIDHHLVLLVWGVVGMAVGSRAFRLRFQKREPAASLEECLIAKGLSAREREIASLMAEGLSNDEIAGRLFISVPTVKTHAFRFFRKLGIRNRVELRYLAEAASPDPGRKAANSAPRG
jgi:DNA-binding CsgD family transcriptional regulator